MLVGMVENLDLEPGDHFELRSEDLWGPQWPVEVVAVHGILLEGDGPPEWAFTDSCWVDETSDEIIQNALDSKERNVMSWRGRFDEAWILLVLDGLVGASMLRPHEQIINNMYQSSFHRAFIIEFNGKTQCITDWANEIGIHESSLRERLEKWPVEKALTTTKRKAKNVATI